MNLALDLPTLFLKGQVEAHFLPCAACKISHCVLKINSVSEFSFPRNHTTLRRQALTSDPPGFEPRSWELRIRHPHTCVTFLGFSFPVCKMGRMPLTPRGCGED